MPKILGKRNTLFKTAAGWCKRFVDGSVVGPYTSKDQAEAAEYVTKVTKTEKKKIKNGDREESSVL